MQKRMLGRGGSDVQDAAINMISIIIIGLVKKSFMIGCWLLVTGYWLLVTGWASFALSQRNIIRSPSEAEGLVSGFEYQVLSFFMTKYQK
jgi:hypothetical protein